MGTPYEAVQVTATTSLDSYLYISGAGKYSGIVSIKKTLLSAAQQISIINYQKHVSYPPFHLPPSFLTFLSFLLQSGVRRAVIGSAPAGLPGLSAGSATSTKGTLALAPQLYSFAHPSNTRSASTPNTRMLPLVSCPLHLLVIHFCSLYANCSCSIAWVDSSRPASITPIIITNSSIATHAIMHPTLTLLFF